MLMVCQTHVGVRCGGSGELIGTATRYHLPGKPESGSLSEVGLVMKDASDEWVPVRGRCSCCTLAFHQLVLHCLQLCLQSAHCLHCCTPACTAAAHLLHSAPSQHPLHPSFASSCCVFPFAASLSSAAAVCVNTRMYIQVEGFPVALYSGSKDCTVRKWNVDEAGLESVSACSRVLGFEFRSCRNASPRAAHSRTRRVWIQVLLIVRKCTLCTTPLWTMG